MNKDKRLKVKVRSEGMPTVHVQNTNTWGLYAQITRLFPFPNSPVQPEPRRARRPMEEVQAAMTAHLDQLSGLVQALSSELRRGMDPAADNLRAFVRAVDWTVSLPNPPIGDRIRVTEISFSFLSPFQS